MILIHIYSIYTANSGVEEHLIRKKINLSQIKNIVFALSCFSCFVFCIYWSYSYRLIFTTTVLYPSRRTLDFGALHLIFCSTVSRFPAPPAGSKAH